MARTRLTHDQIRSIFQSVEPHKTLMREFGVSRATIHLIQSRMTHTDVTAGMTHPDKPRYRGRPRAALTADQVRTVYTSPLRSFEIAIQFNVSVHTIKSIRRRRSYVDLTEGLASPKRRRGPIRRPKPKPKPEPVRPNVVIRLTDAEIQSIYTSEDSDRAEAERYKVKLGLIRNIRDRSIFGYTTMDLRRPRPAIEPEPDQDVQNRGPSRGRFPPTPGVDFQSLASAHRDLERPKGTKRAIRIKPGYQDAPLIIAYLIPLNSRT